MITGFDHQVQLSVFIKAVGMGYFLGIFYSAVRFLNIYSVKSNVAVFLRDVGFFVAAAFFCFMFSLKYCSGMMRFYVTAGELMGYIVFSMLPGKLIFELWRNISEKICSLTKKLFKYTKKNSKKLKFFTKNT